MVGKPNGENTLVFEYHGGKESTKTAFTRLISTLSDSSVDVTGFRLELTTADSFDVPIDVLVSQQSTPEATAHETVDAASDDDTDGGTDQENETDIPSLQSNALPAQVLSLMLDSDADAVRTSEIQNEFDNEEIDTSRISQTLASLKRRELVGAEPDPEDKRANIYWPTDKAQQALRN